MATGTNPMRVGVRPPWIAAGAGIIAYASDVAVLRDGFAAAARRLRPREPALGRAPAAPGQTGQDRDGR